MTANTKISLRKFPSAAICAWENEGGAVGPNMDEFQFGRRIEMDRSWTVYHVFSGVPAVIEGERLTGLNKASATRGMLSLNQHHAAHQKAGIIRFTQPKPLSPKAF
jgi:hypothetical protein